MEELSPRRAHAARGAAGATAGSAACAALLFCWLLVGVVEGLVSSVSGAMAARLSTTTPSQSEVCTARCVTLWISIWLRSDFASGSDGAALAFVFREGRGVWGGFRGEGAGLCCLSGAPKKFRRRKVVALTALKWMEGALVASL